MIKKVFIKIIDILLLDSDKHICFEYVKIFTIDLNYLQKKKYCLAVSICGHFLY